GALARPALVAAHDLARGGAFRHHRAEAGARVTALDWNPSPRKLRQFAAVAVVFLAALAATAHLRGRSELAQALPLGLGAIVGLLAVTRPTALRILYVLLSIAVFPIGFVLSHLILLVVFYGVITPLGVLSRLRVPTSSPCDPTRRRAASGANATGRATRPATFARRSVSGDVSRPAWYLSTDHDHGTTGIPRGTPRG